MYVSGKKKEIKKTLTLPQEVLNKETAINVNGRWVEISNLSDDRELIRYGFDDLDSVYAPINKIHSLMRNIKLRLKDNKGVYIDSHPVLDLIKNPNENQTWNDILGYYVGYKKTTGNYYLLAERTSDESEPIGLYTLPSQYTKVLTSNTSGIYNPKLEGYKIEFNSYNMSFPKTEVCHISETNLSVHTDSDLFYGQSPLRPLARKLRTNNGVLTSAIKLLENGGAQGMLTPHSFVVKEDAPEVTEEFLNNLKASFRKQYQGESNAGSVILTSLPMQWADIGMNLVDMQLFDVDKLTYKSVCNVLGLKDVLFNNDNSSTYNNVRQASQDAYLQVVIPEYRELVDKLNTWLLPMFDNTDGYMLCLDYSEVPEIQEYRMEQSKSLQPFKTEYTTNEIREKLTGDGALDDELANLPIYERDNILGRSLVNIPFEDE